VLLSLDTVEASTTLLIGWAVGLGEVFFSFYS